MPVGDLTLPIMMPVKGVKIGVTQSHIRYPNRNDLVLFNLNEQAQVAGVFTQNAFCAAPVRLAKAHMATSNSRALVINTGNANAGTGDLGMQAAQKSCEAVAKLLNISSKQVLPFSTGVIGEQLPVDRLTAGLPKALTALSEDNWALAASGIMTTDTLPKGASEQFVLDGVTYTITGISKGAGMIRPNMATMLAFVATDMPVAKPVLQNILCSVVNQSFNRITIDGDTSTNDACMLIATGLAGGSELTCTSDARFAPFVDVLKRVFIRLAQLIVRDGEGATKFMTVQVNGGMKAEECAAIAYSIAHSPLIKTAFFASDPNWGRILAAVGYAGVANLDVSLIDVYLDDVQICKSGGRDPSYTEAAGSAVMQKSEITIRIELARGQATDTVWTCDLSYDYVKINADYRS